MTLNETTFIELFFQSDRVHHFAKVSSITVKGARQMIIDSKCQIATIRLGA